MTLTRRILASVSAGLLSLTVACSSDDADGTSNPGTDLIPPASYASEPENVEQSGAEDETSEQADEDVPAPGEVNGRGNIEKQVGEEGAAFGSADAKPPYPMTYVATAIEPNFQCPGEWAQPSENGQFIAISMTVATGPNLYDLTYGSTLWLSNHDFQVIGADGVVENKVATAAAFSCLNDDEQFPTQGLGPGVTANVKFVVDTKAASGYLVFKPGYIAGGWEYTF